MYQMRQTPPDPDSIARGMGPECAGIHGAHRIRYHWGVHSHGSSSYTEFGHSTAGIPTLFTLAEEVQHMEEQLLAKEVILRKAALAEILMHFPTDLVDKDSYKWAGQSAHRNERIVGAQKSSNNPGSPPPPNKKLKERCYATNRYKL